MAEQLVATLARLRRGADDRTATALEHVGQHRLRAQEHALGVDVHVEVPLLLT